MSPSRGLRATHTTFTKPPTRTRTTPKWQCLQCRRHTSSAPTSPASELASARKYCLDTLRRYDTPSSLLLPYIPRHARDAYIALRAFNIEVARTADTTSTPTIGALRLQFQRDAVSKALAGAPPKQPVAILLAKAAGEIEGNGGKWSSAWFGRIVDTREKYLANPPFTGLEGLERYAENTYSTLLYLTLQALPMASLTADHVASHIGKASGIAAVLRGLPLIAFPGPANTHSNQGQFQGDVGVTRHGAVMLPLDIMASTGVREEDVLRNGSNAHGLRDAVFQVATRANDHLITARQMLENIRAGGEAGHEFEHEDEEEHAYLPNAKGQAETQAQEVERAFGVLMPAVATRLWLERLEGVDFDVFRPELRVTDWRLPWRGFWGGIGGGSEWCAVLVVICEVMT